MIKVTAQPKSTSFIRRLSTGNDDARPRIQLHGHLDVRSAVAMPVLPIAIGRTT
jgi:hypothetical protein